MTTSRSSEHPRQRRWQPMEVDRVGRLVDVIQGGTGKLTPHVADPGDVGKPKGQE